MGIAFAEERVLPAMEFEMLVGGTDAIAFPRERPVLLMIADRKGSDQVDAWAERTETRFGGAVEVRGVAMLDSIPKLARGITRRIIPKKSENLLLDWDGLMREHFTLTANEAQIAVVDKQGRILHEEVGAFSDEKWARVEPVLDSLVPDVDDTGPGAGDDAPETRE